MEEVKFRIPHLDDPGDLVEIGELLQTATSPYLKWVTFEVLEVCSATSLMRITDPGPWNKLDSIISQKWPHTKPERDRPKVVFIFVRKNLGQVTLDTFFTGCREAGIAVGFGFVNDLGSYEIEWI